MKKWQHSLLIAAMVGTSVAMATPIAFASTGTVIKRDMQVPVGATSITLSVPDLDAQLQPPTDLAFTFAPQNVNVQPMTTTGTLLKADPQAGYALYTVPLPNFGQPETVSVSTTYVNNGLNYTMTAGPLIDTLPEAPLAAALPLGMLGVWYFQRRRKLSAQS